MIAKGQLINDRYEILKLIGEGGMANVYLARDTILDRRVAVKVLRGDLAGDEKFVRRFQREALSASSLSHPNIVSIYDVGNEDGLHYIVMELIEGKTYLMSPRPRLQHNFVASNIYHIFATYLHGKTCKAIADGTDLFLDKENHYVPDTMIVCDRSKIHRKGIYGAPDLVVEVLSTSTINRDRGPKMRHYAAAGVREYWIVSPLQKSVEVYHNHEGQFELDCVYEYVSAEDFADLDEEDRANVHTVIPVSLYDDLRVRVEDVFDDIDVAD